MFNGFICSKTYCGYCQRVKQLFSQLKATYNTIELDRQSMWFSPISLQFIMICNVGLSFESGNLAFLKVMELKFNQL